MRYVLFLMLAGLSIAGCTENAPHAQNTAISNDKSIRKAECLVCKHNADLGCVDVEVDATTPRTTYAGKEYFFCSGDCKKEFLASPAKFVSAK